MSQLFWQHAKIIFQNKNHLNMNKENPAKRLKFGRNCLIVTLFGPQAPGVQLTWILFLGKYTQSSWCLWLFENEFTKSVRKAPILRQIRRLPSFNGHNSDPRGPIDLNYFPMA